MAWHEWVSTRTERIKSARQWKTGPVFTAGPRSTELLVQDRHLVCFASNDYFGLSRHPAVVEAACRAVRDAGAGTGGSRLACGTRDVHLELERQLADWKHCEAAVLFSSGYLANVGLLASLGGAGAHIISDEFNHASIIDGCRASRAVVSTYPHLDHKNAREQLLRASHNSRCIVVTDSVFSMDGDVAPLKELAAACREFGALLIIDEAHAALGPELDQRDLQETEVLRVGTLSKMLGSLGGFVAGTRAWIDLVVNLARTYRFTTASSPADTAGALAALNILRGEEGTSLRSRLRSNVESLKAGHPSAIVPVLLGDEETAARASATLVDHGYLVSAHFPPVVPQGTCRLRIAVSAAHSPAEVLGLKEVLQQANAPL